MPSPFTTPGPGSFLGLALALGLAFTRCSPGGEDGDTFRYHAATGKCRNAAGEEGHNPYDSASIKGTKRAECVNLAYQHLILLEKDSVTFTHDTLKGWDLRGALFYGTWMDSNSITGADLRGVSLAGLEGYRVLEGKVDSFTAVPQEGCTLTGTSIRCVR